MANTRAIRGRIKSVKNTSQITKAMQMVAASKMRKAQQAATNSRPYAELLNRVLISLRDRVDSELHPLLESREVKKELVILLSTDKGLCGALNTNLFREAASFSSEKTRFVSVGRKGTQFLARMKRDMIADFELKDSPNFLETKAISKYCIEQFLNKEVDRVTVLFPQFINTLTQRPTSCTLLPITGIEEASKDLEQLSAPSISEGQSMLFEPSAADVLNDILPYYVHFEFYQFVLGTRASEHSARMVAMKSATDNAKQLVKDLTLEYNKVRQASITNELLEIATAQYALE